MQRKLYEHVLACLNLSPKQHLPEQGTERIELHDHRFQKVVVWVKPFEPATPTITARRFHRSAHRVMAECPQCKRTVSAGRYEQHIARRDHQPDYIADQAHWEASMDRFAEGL